MSKRDRLLLLEDMLESAYKIRRYTSGLHYTSFIQDDKTKDAVVRNFEIVGEAANKMDSAFKKDHPAISWQRIRGFRNRIIHDYFGIDYEIVWSIVENDLDVLIAHLETLIENYKDSRDS